MLILLAVFINHPHLGGLDELIISRAIERHRRLPEGAIMTPVWVNGSPGVLITSRRGRPLMVNVVDVEGDLVVRQYSILNPDKLAAVGRTLDLV